MSQQILKNRRIKILNIINFSKEVYIFQLNWRFACLSNHTDGWHHGWVNEYLYRISKFWGGNSLKCVKRHKVWKLQGLFLLQLCFIKLTYWRPETSLTWSESVKHSFEFLFKIYYSWTSLCLLEGIWWKWKDTWMLYSVSKTTW